METVLNNDITEEKEIILTPDQEQEIYKNELALLPENERKEVAMVSKPHDLALIDRHKKQITSFKKKFPISKFPFKEGDTFDKDKYEKALAAWQTIKNYRTKNIVPDFKALKGPLNTVLALYNEKQKLIEADIKKIEDPIGEIVDLMESAKKEEAKKEERELEDRRNRRVEEIITAGAVFDGTYYSIGSEEFGVETISLGMADINSMSDEMYNSLLPKIQSGAAIIAEKQKVKDDAAIEAENKKKADFEKEQEDLKKERDALKEKNARLRAKELKLLEFVHNDIARVYYSDPISITFDQVETLEPEEWDKLMIEAEARIEAGKDQKIKQKLFSDRTSELKLLGFSQNVATSSYKIGYKDNSVELNYEGIQTYPDAEWLTFIEHAKRSIEKQEQMRSDDIRIANEKKQLSQEREETLAPYWQFVTAVEKSTLGDLNEESFEFLLSSKKTANENDLKAKDEKKRKEEKDELAKQGDDAIYRNYVMKLLSIHSPEVSTDEYKSKVLKIASFLKSLD